MTLMTKSHVSSHHLCGLPYDIRHLIFSHLFPPLDHEIHIRALPNRLQNMMMADMQLPHGLFFANRQLSSEALEFLYNRYLFMVFGSRRDCFAQLPGFEAVFRKHAKQIVQVDAFGNGVYSSTMCLILQSGNSRMERWKKRRRGEWQDVRLLQSKFEQGEFEQDGRLPRVLRGMRTALLGAPWAVLVLIVAVWLAYVWRGSG